MEAARVSLAVLMGDQAVDQVAREGRLVRPVNLVVVAVQAAGRVGDLLRAKPVWWVSHRRRMPEVHVTKARDPDDQRGPRLVALAHLPIDRQEGRVVHAVKGSRVGKVAQGLKETQESQDQAPRGTIGNRKGLRHMNLDWALPSPQEATVNRASG